MADNNKDATAVYQPGLITAYQLQDISWSTPAICEALTDGQRAVIATDRSGTVHAFSGTSHALLWQRKLEGSITASPIVGDINGDDTPEVVIGTESGWLYALAIDSGEVLWRTRCGNCIRATAAIADCDGDSRVEILIGGYGTWMFCLDGSNGHVKWKRYLPKHEFFGRRKAGIVSSPLVADVDLDGELEIVTGMRSKRVYCLRARDGVFKWFRELKCDPDSSASLAITNGQPVVYIGGGEHTSGKGDNALIALRGTDGKVLWKGPVHGGLDSSPVIADINNDGQPEVVITSLADASCHAFNAATGERLWSYRFGPTELCEHDQDNVCVSRSTGVYWTETAICRSYTTPLVADLDNDGNREVVVGSNNGIVVMLNGASGELLWSDDTGSLVRGSPVLADIDMDGTQELLVTSGDRILIYRTNARGAEWPMFNGAATHAGWIDPVISDRAHTPAMRQRFLWFKLVWCWLIKDFFRYLAFQLERRVLKHLGIRLFDYYY